MGDHPSARPLPSSNKILVNSNYNIFGFMYCNPKLIYSNTVVPQRLAVAFALLGNTQFSLFGSLVLVLGRIKNGNVPKRGRK
jgi:hypothetical protein